MAAQMRENVSRTVKRGWKNCAKCAGAVRALVLKLQGVAGRVWAASFKFWATMESEHDSFRETSKQEFSDAVVLMFIWLKFLNSELTVFSRCLVMVENEFKNESWPGDVRLWVLGVFKKQVLVSLSCERGERRCCVDVCSQPCKYQTVFETKQQNKIPSFSLCKRESELTSLTP